MRLIIAGGGTGGHITPGIAIARELLERDGESQVLFVGTEKGLEMDLVPKAGLPISTIPAVPLIRQISPRLLKTCYSSFKGVLASISLIRRFKPDLILGTGGFVCGPVLLAALLLRVPYVLQEQNVMPGLTNRLFSSFARRIALGFDQARSYFKVKDERLVHTGNPINKDILFMNRLKGAKDLGIHPNRRVLLIYGGSRGALNINRGALEAYPELLKIPDLHILHICGKGNREELLQGIEEMGLKQQDSLDIYDYCYDIAPCLAVADLVVARAGAVGLSEILALGLPSILVPYPHAADNHQYYNARVVEEAGAGIIIPDESLTGALLFERVSSLFNDSLRLKEYSLAAERLSVPESTEKIISLLFNELGDEGIG